MAFDTNATLRTKPFSAPILGTVSYSGGVTGAIMEEGSNANGHYVRYANGVQECWFPDGIVFTEESSGARMAAPNWTYPMSFVGDDPVVTFELPSGVQASAGGPLWENSSGDIRKVSFVGCSAGLTSATQIRMHCITGQTFATNGTVTGSARAIGRWRT